MDSQDFFEDWCATNSHTSGTYRCEILKELRSVRPRIKALLNNIVQTHYRDPQRVEALLNRLGYAEAAKRLNEYLPLTARARSGDIGEILATEYVNRRLPFRVPIFRLRWKDGREMPLRGDDLIAIKGTSGNLQLLKGEIKSRRKLTSTTIRDALGQLRKNSNRPSGHTLNYLVDRLIEIGDNTTAELLDRHIDSRLASEDIYHLLFTLSANDPSNLFDTQLGKYTGPVQTDAVGLVIEDHPDFIRSAYEELKWQPITQSSSV